MRNDKSACNLAAFDAVLWKIRTTMKMRVRLCLCNFKWNEWNPGVHATIEVYLRGLSTKVRVANTSQLHQLAQNGCRRCGNYRNVKYKIKQGSERRKTCKQGNRYYTCTMTKVPVTWERLTQSCGKFRTTMKMTVRLYLHNSNYLQWNPAIQQMIQVQLRGLWHILHVARTDK